MSKGIAFPASLVLASHFHQSAGAHPKAATIRPGEERVELVTGGRGWLRSEGEWVEANRGALLWHVEKDETIGRSDFANPYRCLAAHFRSGAARRGRTAPRISYWGDADEALRFTAETVRRFVDEAFDRALLRDYVYARLLYQARAWHYRRDPSELPEGVRRAREAIRERFADPSLSVAAVAAAAGWSEPHLHERFREALGVTPGAEIRRRRLRAARELLASTDWPVKRIAADCGFGGAAAFCYAFRKAAGQTPGTFRRRHFEGGGEREIKGKK